MNPASLRTDPSARAVGVFDSGIGGLSVLRELVKALPDESFVYFADRAHLPYGEKSLDAVGGYARAVVRFFLQIPVKMVVIACNTASAAALRPLREEYPEMLFVGMEPAVKPAAEHTRTGKVGVLATAGTLRGAPYAGVVERFARGVEVREQPCPGLAALIENGADAETLRAKLAAWIAPLRAAGIDQLALACTHYPLVLPLIREIAGDGINVIDPAPAIARQAGKLLAEHSLKARPGARAVIKYYASADPGAVAAAGRKYGCPGEAELAVL